MIRIQIKNSLLAIALLAILSSCNGSANNEVRQGSQIRIVDLNGNPRPTKNYVPEMNARILASQGMKIDEKTGNLSPINGIAGAKSVAVATAPAPTSVIATTPAPNKAEKPAPTEEAPKAPAPTPIAKKDGFKEESVEYDFSSESPTPAPAPASASASPSASASLATPITTIKEISKNKKFKIVAGKEGTSAAKTSTKPSKGIFIQVGSYYSPEIANNMLTKNQKISAGKVEEARVKGKKFYRVILGPEGNKQEAENILKKLNKAGYKDAFIIKE